MIELKSAREIELMRDSGDILKKVFAVVQPLVSEGRTTDELDTVAEKIIRENGGEPAFKGYCGYPKTTCISINEEVVHGIPGSRKLQKGDVVSFDIGAKLKGYYSDAARTWIVGGADKRTNALVAVAKESLDEALFQYKPGWRIGDFAEVIQQYIETRGFGVVRDYTGHAIGRHLHEDPQVPNYGRRGRGAKIEEGMVLAIEPMVTDGHYAVKTLSDNWTVVTQDGKNASHYEDTIAFVKGGFLNLTRGEA